MAEVGRRLDMGRVHFIGCVPYAPPVRLLQVLAAHVYLTYPFVLSWSMLDAMSARALVIGLRTPPVEEVISHRRNGLLVSFHDVDGIADALVKALALSERFGPLRRAARKAVRARCELRRVCLPAWAGADGQHRRPVLIRARQGALPLHDTYLNRVRRRLKDACLPVPASARPAFSVPDTPCRSCFAALHWRQSAGAVARLRGVDAAEPGSSGMRSALGASIWLTGLAMEANAVPRHTVSVVPAFAAMRVTLGKGLGAGALSL